MAIAIIGGGAAGMMAAATIIEKNPAQEVFLIEKNTILGKKVLISGGGRCNVTTGITDMQILLTKYPRGARFLQHALYAFPPQKVAAWFEEHGIKLKEEPDHRIFPKSNHGKDIVHAFEKLFTQSKKSKILYGHAVEKISKNKNDTFTIEIKNMQPITANKIILTTGGQAHRTTGSTGDGYTFAETLGHTITSLAPSLTSFITQEQWPKKLSGVSLPFVKLSTKDIKKATIEGPMLFTHWGISGPAVFALSACTAFETYSPTKPLQIIIDFFPTKKGEVLAATIEKIRSTNPQKTIVNTLGQLLPKSLMETLCTVQNIPTHKKNSDISKKELHALLTNLKHCTLAITGRGAGDEFVTAGGVALEEVERTTMESKICHGLFFAGEILNIDGFTGGFNLQAAWATGRLAGENAAEN